jgi:hypothetical protein
MARLSPYEGDTDAIGTALSTELNALGANSGKAISAAINNGANPATGWPGGMLFADLELAVDFVTAPTAGTVVELYLLPSIDGGTTYPDGSTSIVPQSSLYVGGFAVRNTTAAQVMVIRGVALPPGYYKYLVQNTTNQAFPATGSTLRYATYAIVEG